MLLLLSTLAMAQEDPVEQCTHAAAGSELEICTRLALEHPEHLDELVVAMRAHQDHAMAGDRELLEALLLLLTDAGGVLAAKRLGELDDPRIIAPLAHAATHREEEVALAAVAALSRQPEALPWLTGWLTDDQVSPEVRAAAARALGDLGLEEGADAMVAALGTRGVPREVRLAMVETVRARFPHRASEVADQVSRDGTPWLVLGGASTLGFTLASAGHFGRADLVEVGGVTGAFAGATLGYVSGRAWPVEAGDAAFLTFCALMGTSGGALLGLGFESEDAPWLGGLAGEAVGVGLAWSLRRAHQGRGVDAWEAMGVSLATGMVAGNVVRRVPGVREELLGGLGVLGGGIAGQLAAPHVDLEGPDAGLLALGFTWGLVSGGMIPVEENEGLPAAWASGGLLLAYGLVPALDADWGLTVGGASGLLYGTLAGTGLGVLIEPRSDLPQALGLGVGTAAMVGGAWLTYRDPTPMRLEDVALSAQVAGWIAWQAAGWGNQLQAGDRAEGVLYLAPALAGAGTALAWRRLDVPLTESLSVSSLGVWGLYVGEVSATLADARDHQPALLVGSGLGLAVGIGLLAPPLRARPLVIGLADAGGVLGGSLGALGASFATEDRDPILVASLVGSGLGATGGALLGVALQRRERSLAWAPSLRLPDGLAAAPTVVASPQGAMPGAVVVYVW